MEQNLYYSNTLEHSQEGAFPFQRPSAWHVLSAVPFSVYPVSHEYLATSPKEMPALVFTCPLLRLSGWPQEMMTESGQLMHGKI